MNNQALLAALQNSSLYVLLMITSRMLAQSGLGNVVLLDRRSSKQKSRFGGHELLCEGRYGEIPVRIVVKVINDGIRLRMLDELAGAVSRMQATFGIIVSPRPLTKSAKLYQSAYNSSNIAVIEGDEFAARLSKLGIGVRSSGEVDYQYFTHLEMYGPQLIDFVSTELP